jgi:hypothetical protein
MPSISSYTSGYLFHAYVILGNHNTIELLFHKLPMSESSFLGTTADGNPGPSSAHVLGAVFDFDNLIRHMKYDKIIIVSSSPAQRPQVPL